MRGLGGGRRRAPRAQALSSEALLSARGAGFILSLFQGRNRPGGGCMVCQPDLAKYLRKTFLIMNVFMKEQTAPWSKDGPFEV